MCEVMTIMRECVSIPGLVRMYLIDVDDVLNIPTPNKDWIIEDDIILQPKAYFKTIAFREQSAGLGDELVDSIGGGFRKNLGLKIKRYGNTSNQWVFNMVGTRFIMLIEDFNEQVLLIGDLQHPMRMDKASGNTGQKMGDENAWIVNLLADTTRPCYVYEGAIPLQGQIPATFVIYWGWGATAFTPANLITFAYQKIDELPNGVTTIATDFTTASVNNYLAVKFPYASLPLFTKWKNTDFNQGQIPDQIFYPIYTSGDFAYTYTRVIPALDKNTQQITFS